MVENRTKIEQPEIETQLRPNSEGKYKIIFNKVSFFSKYKIELIDNILAQKEMYIGRHYIKKKKQVIF